MPSAPRPVLPHVVVVGGGTAGLASAWQLAERGARVTVLDPHEAPHEEGSHGGYTRAIRHAYHEGTSYVPLVREADRMWCELEQTPGELLQRTGMIEIGPPGDAGFQAVLEACEQHGIEHRRFDADGLRAAYPFVVPDGWQGCFTPSGGYLRVGACLQAMRARAEAAGAVVRRQEAVAVEPGRVVLDDGVLDADAIVVAAGARTPALLPGLPLRPVRRVLFWLRTPADWLRGPALPVWGVFDGESFFYGFPPGDEGLTGFKLACHTSTADPHLDDAIDPDTLDRDLRPQDWAPVRDFLATHLPGAGSERIAHGVCMYTTTPSWDFFIDRHPSLERVVVVSGLSGHGFKFAPALGRLAADLVLTDAKPQPEFATETLRVLSPFFPDPGLFGRG